MLLVGLLKKSLFLFHINANLGSASKNKLIFFYCNYYCLSRQSFSFHFRTSFVVICLVGHPNGRIEVVFFLRGTNTERLINYC